MTNQPFLTHLGDNRYQPNDICRGPWDPNSLHGRVVAGLLAHAIETAYGESSLHPARLTVDLYRVPPFAPVEVATSIERDGNRIRVVDATFVSNGTPIARASCVFLRRAENPEGTVWSPPSWDVPHPDSIPPATQEWGPRGPMWDTRAIGHGFGSTEQKRAWLRENRPLADGVEMTPFVRAAFAADFTNPFANSGSAGLKFVNADITLYLHRLPVGEWLGFEVVEHHATHGIALGECSLYDTSGPIGRSLVTALANRRKGEG